MRKVVVLISVLVAITFHLDVAFAEHSDIKKSNNYAQLSQAAFLKNNNKALSLLTELAQQASREAQVILANGYLQGFIARENKNDAPLLYRQAAFSKKPIALLAQGCFLQNSNPKIAFALFLETAQQNDALAEY